MLYRIGPIEMVAYCKNYVPGFLVNAYNIDNIKLLNRHCYSPIFDYYYGRTTSTFVGGIFVPPG